MLFASAAIAQIHDRPPAKVSVAEIHKEQKATKSQARKLVLPNVAALTAKAWTVELDVLKGQQVKSATVVAFFENRGKWLLATRHDKCWGVPWQRSCTIARATHRLHTELLRISTRRLLYEITSVDGNWTRAMRFAQRPFPGTYDWLESISNRECRACYTPSAVFTCNYQGSGACGPMQFKAGTFYGHADDAEAWMKRNGFIVPEGTWEWQNPLGQALTAAFMRYTHIDGCHWCL